MAEKYKLPHPPLPHKERNYVFIISIIGIILLIALAFYAIIGFVQKERPAEVLTSEQFLKKTSEECLVGQQESLDFIAGNCKAIEAELTRAQCELIQGKKNACNNLKDEQKSICIATTNKDLSSCQSNAGCLSSIGIDACNNDPVCIALANKDSAYFERFEFCSEILEKAKPYTCAIEATSAEETEACFTT